jgi:glycosyltransferase involved in cell wall biosynthesis
MMNASSKGLSICMLVTDIDAPTGGIQKQSLHLIKALSRKGGDTFICTRNYHKKSRKELRDGVYIRRSPVVGRSIPIVNSIIYLIDSLIWLIKNRNRFDLIHCQQMFGPAFVALIAKIIIKKPVLVRVTLSGPTGEVSYIKSRPLAKLRIHQLKSVERWVALTSEMKRELCELGIPSEKILIIPNSTHIPSEASFYEEVQKHYRTLLKLTESKKVIFSGRLSQEKGVDTLLNAWALIEREYNNAELLILGDGGAFRNVEAELHRITKDLNLKRVQFLGYVPNVTEYLLASDIFVLPTRAEGMSNSLVEAMAAGLAIVTTNIPANSDLFEHGMNALIVPPDDVKSLQAAIGSLLNSPKLALRLASNARKKAETQYTFEIMTSRYIDAYHSLIST